MKGMNFYPHFGWNVFPPFTCNVRQLCQVPNEAVPKKTDDLNELN